jgi:hypothetical protein
MPHFVRPAFLILQRILPKVISIHMIPYKFIKLTGKMLMVDGNNVLLVENEHVCNPDTISRNQSCNIQRQESPPQCSVLLAPIDSVFRKRLDALWSSDTEICIWSRRGVSESSKSGQRALVGMRRNGWHILTQKKYCLVCWFWKKGGNLEPVTLQCIWFINRKSNIMIIGWAAKISLFVFTSYLY